MDYSPKALSAIYELGRLYFEMGYFAPAERIFSGLVAVDSAATPAHIGLGLIKLECGLFSESISTFREALEKGTFSLQAKVGLAAAFICTGEVSRARSLLTQVGREQGGAEGMAALNAETKTLWEALMLRCEAL